MYDMAKVHKPDVPLRPVVFVINTLEYKLAKFFNNPIKPHVSDTFLQQYNRRKSLLRAKNIFLVPEKTIWWDLMNIFIYQYFPPKNHTDYKQLFI